MALPIPVEPAGTEEQAAAPPSRRSHLFLLTSVFFILLLYAIKIVGDEAEKAGKVKNFKVQLKNQKGSKHDVPSELLKDMPSDEIKNLHDIPSEVLNHIPCETRIQNIVDEFGGDLKDRSFLLTSAMDAAHRVESI